METEGSTPQYKWDLNCILIHSIQFLYLQEIIRIVLILHSILRFDSQSSHLP